LDLPLGARFFPVSHGFLRLCSNNTKYDQYSQSNPWTLKAYNSASPFQKFLYKATYTPLAFLFVMPWITFGLMFSIKARWWENALNAVYFYFAWQYEILTVEAISWALSAGLGFYLFHLQHTFEGSHRWTPLEWSFFQNGMESSSFLQVPWFLKYFTANIEYHHIHHLSPLVPLYKLPQCHETAGKMFDRVPRVSMLDGFKMLTPMVWDEDKNQFQKLSW
jgi:acyl-lipid omega-6 desaturase (Delta-12 desaturase)